MTDQLMFMFEESIADLHQDVPDQAYVDGLIELAYACAETDVLRSLSLAQEAVSVAGPLNYARGRAAGLICIGQAQLTLGQPEQALSCTLEAMSLVRALQDKALERRVLHNLFAIHRVVGNYPEAVQFGLQALTLAQQMCDRNAEVTQLNALGVQYLDLNDYAKALALFEQAEAIHQDNGTPIGKPVEAQVLHNIALAHLKLGDYSLAIHFAERVLNINTPDHFALSAAAYARIGEAYLEMDADTQGLDYMQQALGVCAQAEANGKLVSKEAVLPIQLDIARAYERRGRYTDALSLLTRALADAEAAQMRKPQTQIHELLDAVYRALGQTDLAQEHEEKGQAIRQQLLNQEATQRIYALQMMHEANA